MSELASKIPPRTPPRWPNWIDGLSTLLAALAAVATALMMVNIIVDVVARVATQRPLPGTLELTQYAWMPTLVSLALGYALLRGEHLRVSLLTGPTGPRTQRIIEIVGMVATLLVVALFGWFGVERMMTSVEITERSVGSPWLVIWPYRVILVVGLIGLFLQAAAELVRAATAKEFVPLDEDEAIALLENEESMLLDVPAKPSGERR